MKTGIELIAEERQRQISVEGFSPEDDNNYTTDELAVAAACYALPAELRIHKDLGSATDRSFVPMPTAWPWGREWWKPSPENRIRELQKAGALIAAEIDRIMSTSNKALNKVGNE